MFDLSSIGMAGTLVVLAIGLSWVKRLGLAKDLSLAAVRAFVQLMAVGFVLEAILRVDRLAYVGLMLLAMVGIAAYTASHRERQVPHALAITTLSLILGVTLTLGIVIAGGVVPPKGQLVIPIASMIIGNAMNAASLALNRLRGEITAQRASVEAALALGATTAQAIEPSLRAVLQASLLPSINRTMTVGLVTLPGSMSGMILAGASPLDAVRYQAIIEYVLIGSVALTSFCVVALAYRGFFTAHHQLRQEAFL